MAQHIDLLEISNSGDAHTNRDVKRAITSIKNDFSKGLNRVMGSLKYNYEDWYTKEYAKSGEKNVVVFTRNMKIYLGKENANIPSTLEIHYDAKKQKITHIYLVM